MYMVLAVLLVPCLAGGDEPLLIAVACDDVEATSVVGTFAARSRYYLLFAGITMVEVLRNPFLDKGPGAGPLVVNYLAKKGVAILIAGEFGTPMVKAMNKKGIKYFQFSGIAQEAAERAIDYLKPKKNSSKGKTGGREPG
jgi:predicted Fe-Mo cluster-binding NifX family protein